MSMTVDEAERMEKSRITAGKLGAINFSYRCVAAFRFARELIRAIRETMRVLLGVVAR